MKVYRVQDAEGRGPWRPGFSHKWVGFRTPAEDVERMQKLPPWPHQFGFKILKQVKAGEAIGCGCENMDQIGLWFSRDELDRLHIFGFHLVTMDADRILAKSDVQCVFVRSKPLNADVQIIE